MAVFWFGWAKKLKNIFTKQQADQYYLQKNSNQLQNVNGLVDFYNNVVCKRNGYVDNVDTNGPTSMINKRYLEEQTLSKTSTGTQTVAGQTVFSKTGEVIKINSNSDTSTYLSGYKSNNERIWYFGKGSSTSNNLVIGADKNDIKLEPKGKVDLSNKKIGWLADPTADQDAANKRYVDNSRTYIEVFSNTSTVYNNLDKIQLTNPADFTEIERNIPWIIRFDRIVKSSGAYEGTVSYSFILPDRGKATFATSRMYYVVSSGNFEEGSRVGISIKVVSPRAYELKIQIWDQTKAIKNITLYKPQL